MKLGIFGGSFDPIHLGHLLVAQAALEELALDKLLFVPASVSPFRPEKMSDGKIRLRWLRMALAGKRNCEVDDQEILRGGISYTVETLRDYKKKIPGAELFFLIGADNVAKLGEWREANELATLAEFVAVPRPGGAEPNFPPHFRGRVLRGFPFGVSSSEIRARIKNGLSVESLVPAIVLENIRAEKNFL